MNVDAYLKRIKSEHLKNNVSYEALRELQRNHLLNIRFENIDIGLKRKIEWNLKKAFEKIINHQRGGVCFELNRLFAWLLIELGFKVETIPSRVFYKSTCAFFNKYAHIALLVHFEKDGKSYLSDVGFSFGFLEPLEFVCDKLQNDITGKLKIEHLVDEEKDSYGVYRTLNNGKDWQPLYLFNLNPREEDEYQSTLEWVQTKECARCYNRTLCIRLFENKILMLTGYRLLRIVFDKSFEVEREEKTLSLDEAKEFIKDTFDIELDCDFTPVHIDL
jgi:N-hydroxyarylamine O-acetyltransferase